MENATTAGTALVARAETAAVPRMTRITIGRKLGLVFAVFFLVTAGNLYFAATQFDGIGDATRMVDNAGRLRYLSQKIAYLATRFETGDRDVLGRQVEDYSATLATIRGALDAHGTALANGALREEIAALERQWTAYRGAVETIRRSHLPDQEAKAALAYLHDAADSILDQADRIVSLLVAAERSARRQLHERLAGVLALEGLFLLAIITFVQWRISAPLRRLSALCREFAGGRHSVRMPVRTRDEIGELAKSFNATAEITASLIRDLNKRTRESTLLHHLAKLLQGEEAVSARVLQQAVALLPQGWQYAEVAAARITYGDAVYQTPDFASTPWCQRTEFRCSAGRRVVVEVCYREARPAAAEGPFLAEERFLIEAVGEMIGAFIESLNTRRAQARLIAILEETTDLVGSFRPDGTLFYLNQSARRLCGIEAGEELGNVAALYPEWVATLQRRIALPTAARERIWSGEIAVRTADGREVPMSQTIIAHKSLDGSVSYYSTIARDIGDRIAMEERLTASRDFYLSLFQAFPDPVWRIDAEGHADYFNRAWLDFVGEPLDRQVDGAWSEAIHPEDRGDCLTALRAAVAAARDVTVEFRLRRRSGEYRWLLGHGGPYRDIEGNYRGLIGICYDITDRKSAEAALLASREDLRTLFQAVEQSGHSVVITDVRGTIQYVNPYFSKVTGYSAAEAVGQNPRLLKSGNRSQDEYRQLWQTITGGNEWRGEFLNRRKNGEYYWESAVISPVKSASGDITHFVAVKEDITERKRIEQELERLANFDSLTGLPNRHLLTDRLAQALAFARRRNRQAAVIFLDLDRFKTINDTLGHACGDRLLCGVAERLRTCLREGDTVARIGGDEFVVVLPDLADDGDVDGVAQKLLGSLAAPIVIDDNELFVSVSLGVSVYPRDGEDIQTLLKNADAAMYHAKDAGRNNYKFYAADMNARALDRLALENSLRRALERREFLLHYQPQVDLTTGHIVGMEALVRWQHPESGLIPPARFIPLAEETGIIEPLGEWVLHEACARMKEWHAAGLAPHRIAVNISCRQFRQKDFTRRVADILAATGLEGSFLCLELTESMLMHDPDEAIAVLRELKKMGIGIAVDDFGTGYSSLSYLKRFPIDEIKIDQGFVRDITQNPEDAAIALAVIGIARSLDLRVVAEGVETVAQLNYLRRHRCHETQGYLFSPPLAADDLTQLLKENRKITFDDEIMPARTLLIVDDEPNVAAALQRVLRQEGYRILTAADPNEGLELLAANDVQVIISDQRMPGMTGTEFLSRAKRLHPETIRIVLSGYTELKSVTDAINQGAIYKFLTKPWDDKLLREHIREAFWRYEAARNLAASPNTDNLRGMQCRIM